jgi:hypothetical protein
MKFLQEGDRFVNMPTDIEATTEPLTAYLAYRASILARVRLIDQLDRLKENIQQLFGPHPDLGYLTIAAWDHAIKEATRWHWDTFGADQKFLDTFRLVHLTYEAHRSNPEEGL